MTTTLPPIDKTHRLTIRSDGTTRRECWKATTRDGRYTFVRLDEPGTPWLVCDKNGTPVTDRFGELKAGTLGRARQLAARHDGTVA